MKKHADHFDLWIQRQAGQTAGQILNSAIQQTINETRAADDAAWRFYGCRFAEVSDFDRLATRMAITAKYTERK